MVASHERFPSATVNVETGGACHKKGVRFVGRVINAFDPPFPSRKFVQLIEDQKPLIEVPPLLEDVLPIFIQVPVQVSARGEMVGKNAFGEGRFPHLARAAYENHF
jgi:hypothetical protein